MLSRMEFVENQRSLCKLKEVKMGLPEDGRCPNCGADITSHFISLGLTGGEGMIIRCPYCYYGLYNKIKSEEGSK